MCWRPQREAHALVYAQAGAPVTQRNAFYSAMVAETVALGAAGLSPWAFSGQARPRQPPGTPKAGGCWQDGDPLLGDPPHEKQGWYGIYDHDQATLDVLSDAASRFGGSAHAPV